MDSAQPVEHVDISTITKPANDVEAYLDSYLTTRPLPVNLDQAVRYSLFGPGKRLRPVLVIRCCEAAGGQAEQAYAAAGAIELIHCFSLVHDDLPAMDDDNLRRGRPTLHRHTNEAMAILAGDAMMGIAFELVADQFEPRLAARISLELASATNAMIYGQVYDTLPDFEEDVPPFERLKTVHRNKTGALIRCACRMGAICAGADENDLAAITKYGQNIGLMFQVIDDLLDVTSTTEQLGKTANKDAEQGKLTYPGLLGVPESKKIVQQLRIEAINSIESFGQRSQMLRDLCEYMAVRTH